MPDGQFASAAACLTRVALGRLCHQIDQQQPEHDFDSARHSIAVIETCSSFLADIALMLSATDRAEG